MKYRDISIYKNVPYVQNITVYTASGQPQNLTGYTGKMYLAKHHESESKFAIDLVIVNVLTGLMKISISAASTAQLPTGNMVYSVFIRPPAEEEILLVQGIAFIEPTVHP